MRFVKTSTDRTYKEKLFWTDKLYDTLYYVIVPHIRLMAQSRSRSIRTEFGLIGTEGGFGFMGTNSAIELVVPVG